MVIRFVRLGLLGLVCVASGPVLAGSKKPQQRDPGVAGACAQQEVQAEPLQELEESPEPEQVQEAIVVKELEGPFRPLIRKLVLRCKEGSVPGIVGRLSDAERGELRELLVQERILLEHGISMAGLVGGTSWFNRGCQYLLRGCTGWGLGTLIGFSGGLAVVAYAPAGLLFGATQYWMPVLVGTTGVCATTCAAGVVAHEYSAAEMRTTRRCQKCIARIDYILEFLGN